MADQVDYTVARRVLSQLAAPVVIVGAADGQDVAASTGTAMYVSFVPPRVAIALWPGSRTHSCIAKSGCFSLSVLAADQVGAADAAGRAGEVPAGFASIVHEGERIERFGIAPPPTPGSEHLGLAPALRTAALVIWCRVVGRFGIGDHELFVGEVTAVRGHGPERPLLRYRRRYAALRSAVGAEDLDDYPT